MASSPKRDRRQEVLSAAAKLFVANGYMSTTMDDIADTVSLNKGTLYYYYDNKATILFDIIHQMEEGRLRLARTQPSDLDPKEALSRFIEETAVYILANLASARISMQESPFVDLWLTKEQTDVLRNSHAEFQAHLLKPISKGVEMGIFAALDARVVTESINGMLAWLPRWFRPKGRLSSEQIARQISNLVISGLESRPQGAAVRGRGAESQRGKSRRSKTTHRESESPPASSRVANTMPEQPKRGEQLSARAKRRRTRAELLNDELY